MSPFTKTPKIGALRSSGLTPSSIILHSMKVNHCFFHVFPWYPFILHGFSSHIPWIFHGTPWIIFGKLTPGCNSGPSCWSSTGTARWGWKWSSPPCMLKWYTICVQPYAKNSMYYIYIYMCVCVHLNRCKTSLFFLPSVLSPSNNNNAGGQSSLMLLCPTKLCIREGSIHWPWMCTCKHV